MVSVWLMIRTRALALTVLFLTLGVALPAASGQLSNLDKTTLIDVLARDGMDQLLARLAEVEPADDPVIQELIQIGRLRIKATDPDQERNQQLALYEQMVDAWRGLIKEHPDHDQRPVWQTDLANLLLFDYLQAVQQHADAFYEFGVPTTDQRNAFESVVAEAYEQLAEADLRFFQLSGELPRQPDHDAKRVQTGLWDRMMKQYYKTKTQFLLGLAAYDTALLSNDHPYYKHLNNPKIPRQKKTPQEERDRLLALAVTALDQLAQNPNDVFGLRWPALCLTGRGLLAQGQFDEAIDKLNTVAGGDRRDLNQMLGQLAKAKALAKKGQPDQAQRLLNDLSSHPVAQENLIFRLLVVDQDHRLKLAKALAAPRETQPEQIAQAYEPYEELLSDPGLGENATGLKNYIYARWESQVQTDQNLDQMPSSVLAAAGEMARIAGQALVYQADQLDENQAQRAEELWAQANPKLERSIQINTHLRERQNLAPRVQASVMFNLAMATYLQAQGDPEQLIEAANLWSELAEQLPDQPLAEEGMTTAIAVLRHLHAMEPKPHGVAEAYARTAKVLFEKFPTSPAADHERVYYTFYVLTPRGRYDEAVDLLSKTPKNHTLYFEAQRELLHNLMKLFDQAEKVLDKQLTQKRASDHASRIIDEARAADGEADPQRHQDARVAHGTARLVLVDIALAQNQVDQALAGLEGFEDEFEDTPDLVRQALAKGIVVHAQEGGDEGPLVNRAKKMMNMFPDDAAAVIDGVLTDLTERIDQFHRTAQHSQVQREKDQMLKRAKNLARAAQMLAELLLDWAINQNFDKTDLVPFKLLLAKAARLAGQFNVAMDTLNPLLQEYPDDTELIFHAAETLFAMGDEKSLLSAAQNYDRLIVGISAPFPPVWWRAWLGRLQIMDKLNQSVEDIPLRVRALELTDPNLGGEPYRSEFKRLQLKHAQ